MTRTENFEQVEVTSAEDLRDWLAENHTREKSIWVVTYKAHVREKYVSVQEILDEVLCFGWVDGVRRKLDADRTMQLLSPRRTQHWARSYKDRAARLTEEGRMHPAGLKAIAESKRNGLWNFMDDVDALVVPGDLADALAARPPATAHFDRFAQSKKRNTLRWIKLAKTPETRAKRIDQTAALAQDNRTVPHM